MEKVKTFTGEEVIFYGKGDDHYYTDLDGNRLSSGSQFPQLFFKPFDSDMIARKTAKKHDTDVQTVKDIWSSTGKVSTDFGQSVHGMLERHFKYRDNGAYKMPKHTYLSAILESFPMLDAEGDMIPEACVSSVKRLMVGFVDNIIVLDWDKKICDIWDYKISYDITRDIKKYEIQLNFYGQILKYDGWTVRKRYIFNYGCDGWETLDIPKIDITKLREWTS